MEAKRTRTNSEAEPEEAGKSREKSAAEERRRRPWKREAMTAAQLQEFQMQAMAYRYIAAGLPVPVHLVVPIWNSLALSSWSHYLTMIHHHHPSRLSYQGFYDRAMADPEPTRCRRTDGKKWRCSKDVVPFQKYCQRHMHRGRKRSRKLVESSEVASSAPILSVKQENSDGLESFTTETLHHGTTASSSKAPVVTIASYTDPSSHEAKNNSVEDTVSHSSLVILASANKSVRQGNRSGENVDLNDKDESSGFRSDYFIMKQKDLSTDIREDRKEFYPKSVQGHDRLPSEQSEPKSKPGSYPETSGKQWRSGEDGIYGRRYFNEFGRSGTEVSDASLEAAHFLESSKKDKSRRSRHVNCNYSVKWRSMNVSGCMVPGMHFSPDSVLQAHGGLPLNRAETENEPGRCRRTDGKKWRCSKAALPGQKYCPKHMHRGVKKRPGDTNAEANRCSIPYAVIATAGSVSSKDRDENATMNTKLSVAVLANPQSQGCDDKSSSSCSTDTTITDTALRGEDTDDLSLCSGV